MSREITNEIEERHRHRYEVNNEFRDQFAEAGLIASGTSPDGSLVEICEIRDHLWMVGTQFHPELRSRPNRPHPLFAGFVGAAVERNRSRATSSAPNVAPHSRRLASSPGARASRSH